MTDKNEISRRSFIREAAVTSAAVSLVPRHVLGRGYTPPSDTLNVACVGVGGMGRSNLINLASQNIVALCDVDWGYTDKNLSRLDTDVANLQQHIDHPDATPANGKPAPKIDPEKTKERLNAILHLKNDLIPKAKRYSDYRKMLEQQKDIDAVVIATPDHMHATIALACMDLGKHVYVQKPLCWSVDEARRLAKRAKETKVATQMGNQGHSLDDARTAVEYVWSGAIGEVREIHVWTDRPVGFWPQGVPRLLSRWMLRSGIRLEWTCAWPQQWRREIIRCRIRCPGISSLESAPTFLTTRFIIPSTGADGRTGAWAQSATWARICWTFLCGR
jgi:hypothetical protein